MKTRLAGATFVGCLLMTVLLFSLKSSNSSYAADIHAELARPPQIPQSQLLHDVTPVAPLPGGCVGALPPDSSGCLKGFVYMNGEAVDGAQVEIQYQNGITSTIYTQVFPTIVDKRPHCNFPLHSEGISPGSVITLTARYGGHEAKVVHTVKAGDQQVDIVFPRRSEADRRLQEESWPLTEAGYLNWPIDIAVDRDNQLYVADRSNARIQVFTADGQFIRQWGTKGNAAGQFREIVSLAIDPQGTVYVADRGRKRIMKFYTNGRFVGENDYPYATSSITDMTIGQDGYIYLADAVKNCIWKYNFDTISADAWACTDNESPETSALLNSPYGIVFNVTSQMLYVADNSSRVIQFNSSGQVIKTILTGDSWWPRQLTIDGQGNLYFIGLSKTNNIDPNANVIGKIDLSGPNPDIKYFPWCTPDGDICQMNAPWSIVVDQNDIIYVPERNTGNVLRMTTDGLSLSAWARSISPEIVIFPHQILFDNANNRYILDRQNNRIQIVTNSGITYTVGGLGTRDGELYNPMGIDVDTAGNIYVADTGNNRIQKLDNTGQFLEKWDGMGSTVGQFNAPRSVAVSATEAITMYVADTANNQILALQNGDFMPWCPDLPSLRGPSDIEIDKEGYIYSLHQSDNIVRKIGIDCSIIFEIGTVTSTVQLSSPFALSVDSSNLYIADTRNNRVLQFDLDGNLLSQWGYSAPEAREFGAPENVSTDADNNLYVLTLLGNTILRSQFMTYTFPIGTITQWSNNATHLYSNQEITIVGSGQVSDENHTIVKYQWMSSKDGEVGTTSTLKLAGDQLSPGAHRIWFYVEDDQGQRSKPVDLLVYVYGYPLRVSTPTPTATPTSILTPDPNHTPTKTPQPIPTSTPNISEPAQWTMLLYYVCDYDDGGELEKRCQRSVDELVSNYQNINPNVRIAIQMDGSGMNGTTRWLLYPGKTFDGQKGFYKKDIGEQPMEKPATLAAFVEWGLEELQEENYYLAIINHGQAIKGIGWDKTSGHDNFLSIKDIGAALENLPKPDILHLDGCSMGSLEVAFDLKTAFAPKSDNEYYLISSQNLVWSYLAYWDYQKTVLHDTTPKQFAEQIVNVYANLAQRDDKPFTLSVLDLSQAQALNDKLEELVDALILWKNSDNPGKKERIEYLLELRKKSQKFEFNGDYEINEIDAYIDLYDWVEQIQTAELTSANLQVEERSFADAQVGATEMLSIFDSFVVTHAVHSGYITPQDLLISEQLSVSVYNQLTQSHGVSIFYPWGAIEEVTSPTIASHVNDVLGFNQIYTNYINGKIFDFTNASHWEDFLREVVGEELPSTDHNMPVNPLAPLSPPLLSRQIFLPIIIR